MNFNLGRRKYKISKKSYNRFELKNACNNRE
jgi:hypothetical protein